MEEQSLKKNCKGELPLQGPLISLFEQLRSPPQPQSHHEQTHSDMADLYRLYLQNTRELYEDNPNSQGYAKLVQEATAMGGSLWGYGIPLIQQWQALAQPNSFIIVSHHCHQSQAPLLALCAKHMGKNVALRGSQDNLTWDWPESVISHKQVDKVTAFTALMKTEQIELSFFGQPTPVSTPAPNSLTIIDLHNTPAFELPLDLPLPGCVPVPPILYTSPWEVPQLESYIERVCPQAHIHVLDAGVRFPVDSIQFEGQQWLYQLAATVRESRGCDVVVFGPQHLAKDIRNFLRKEHLALLDSIHIVTKPGQTVTCSPGKPPSFLSSPEAAGQSTTKIFVCQNFDTLKKMGYSLINVFMVVDFMEHEGLYFDYHLMTYISVKKQSITLREFQRRNSILGVNLPGKYLCRSWQALRPCSSMLGDSSILDIGLWCLLSIEAFGRVRHQAIEGTPQDWAMVDACLSAMEREGIVAKQGDSYVVENKRVLESLRQIPQINPLICAQILRCVGSSDGDAEAQKMSMLLAMSASIMTRQESLRSSMSKPTNVWKQSGYLHSALDILVRAKIIEERELSGKTIHRSVSKTKKQSQMEEDEEMFGGLFDVIMAQTISFDEMSLEDLIREQFVNLTVFQDIVDFTEKVCAVLNVSDVSFNSFDCIDAVMKRLIAIQQKNIGMYSGFRRIGYLIEGREEKFFPSKDSLISILNQRPPLIFILRLEIKEQTGREKEHNLLMSNAVSEPILLEALGSLPCRKTQSMAESQFEYHGIPSGVFARLWRHSLLDVEQFENEYECFVEPNEELAIIAIHSPRDREKEIKGKFDEILERTKEKILAETKMYSYLQSTKLRLGFGGQILEVLKDKYIDKCLLSNLDVSVTTQDLHDLFDEFFNLKNIEIPEVAPSSKHKSAVVTFQRQKDYGTFCEYFDECQYMGRYMKVTPIVSHTKADRLEEQMYLELFWSVWKSDSKAIIRFSKAEETDSCLSSLLANNLDGRKVEAQLLDPRTILIDKMNPLTDEVVLERSLGVYGKVDEIEVLRMPQKEKTGVWETQLEAEILRVLGLKNPDPNILLVKKVKKLKNGLRKCRVIFKDVLKMNDVLGAFNGRTGIVGVARVNVKSWFAYPIKIPHGYSALYEHLIREIKAPSDHKPLIELQTLNGEEYLLVKTNIEEERAYYKNKISLELHGIGVELTSLESSILMTEIGIQNLLYLEEKYECRIIADLNKKSLRLLCANGKSVAIQQQIKAKVQDSFFYRVSLNHKSFKSLKEDTSKLEAIKTQYFLTSLELEEVGRNLLLEGSANNVSKAFNYLMHVIESLSKPSEEEILNMDVCGICCEEPERAFRLQRCSHKFCFACLLDNTVAVFGDMSLFPIKCPQCLMELTIVDLEEILSPDMWEKLVNIAISQYIGRNPELAVGCFTPGCKQINIPMADHLRCDECNIAYCLECKQNYHKGETCEEARMGGNALFEKYMKENDIRKCANALCKMPLSRIDGCYRVTCTRCNKSMCFKCQPDKMTAYDDYNECYKHLNDVHGGYW